MNDPLINRWCECCQREVAFEDIVKLNNPGGIVRALPMCIRCWKGMTKYERVIVAHHAKVGSLLQNLLTLAYKGDLRIWPSELD